MGMLNDALADYYCIKIRRYGCLGLEEEAGAVHEHARTADDIRVWLDTTMATLGPGDRAEITLTRGLQTEEAARAAREAREPVDPPQPGATQAGSAGTTGSTTEPTLYGVAEPIPDGLPYDPRDERPDVLVATLRQYTIYDHPKDFPDGFVVREWEITAGATTPGPAVTVETLEEARAVVPGGLFRIDRAPDDDPVIVETWT